MKSYDKLPENVNIILDCQFIEGQGTFVRDLSKSHNSGALVGAPAWTQLASGKWVVDFDAFDDELTWTALAFGEYVFEWWGIPQIAASRNLISLVSNVSQVGIRLNRAAANDIELQLVAAAGVQETWNSAAFFDGGYHMLHIYCPGANPYVQGTATCFVDGVALVPTGSNNGVPDAWARLHIGDSAGGHVGTVTGALRVYQVTTDLSAAFKMARYLQAKAQYGL